MNKNNNNDNIKKNEGEERCSAGRMRRLKRSDSFIVAQFFFLSSSSFLHVSFFLLFDFIDVLIQFLFIAITAAV